MRIVALILGFLLSFGIAHAQTATTTKVCDASTASCTPYGTGAPPAPASSSMSGTVVTINWDTALDAGIPIGVSITLSFMGA